MMPQPNHSSSNEKNIVNGGSGNILYETKPNLLTYPDNFISKIIVVFLLAFFFVPILSVVAEVQLILINTFGVDIPQLTSFCELILILIILFVIIKIALDVIDRNHTTYTLTSRYIIINRGIFRHEKLTMSYDKIQDLEIQQSVLERLLNVGDIIIYGGHDNSKIILDDTPNAKYVVDLIIQQQDEYNIPEYQQKRQYPPRMNYNPNEYQDNYNPNEYQDNEYQDSYNPNEYQQPQKYNQRHNQYPQQYNNQREYEQPRNYRQQPQRQNRDDDNYFYYNEKQQYDRNPRNSNYFNDKDNSFKKRHNNKKSKKNKKQYNDNIIKKHEQMFKKYNQDDE